MAKNAVLRREQYRLWYEFLKRAKHQKLKVSKSYDDWGDTSIGFDRWWRDCGSKIISEVANGVHVATDASLHNDNYYLVAIPKHISPRLARVQTEQLMKELKKQHGTHKFSWQLTEGKMPHWQSVRAYLHALDCQDMLVKQAVESGGSAKDVKSKHVLAALREYYIKKSIRYKNTGDPAPLRLFHGGRTTDPDLILHDPTQSTSDLSDPQDAINAVSDYLRKANKILLAVRDGKFPS
jgi:hypothetical protein